MYCLAEATTCPEGKKPLLHSLSGLENLYIHEVSKSPVRLDSDLTGGSARVNNLIMMSHIKACIRESVDSLCRDGSDTPIVRVH